MNIFYVAGRCFEPEVSDHHFPSCFFASLIFALFRSNLTHSQKENARYKKVWKLELLGSLTETRNRFLRIGGF